MEGRENIILAIETAVQGGSISLLRGAAEFDYWIGADAVSKSAGILEEIKRILEKNRLEKRTIKKIVVSRGPGSYTGVRVGMAIGLGLKRALGCELVGISSLEAMFLILSASGLNRRSEIITAVPVGRNQVCWQDFADGGANINNEPAKSQTSTMSDFLEFCERDEIHCRKTLVLHNKLYLGLLDKFGERWSGQSGRLIDAGENIAGLNGRAEMWFGAGEFLPPIYDHSNKNEL